MVRRLKSEIKNWDGTLRFPKRELEPIEVPYSDEEKRVHNLLSEYIALRAASYRDNSEKFATEFVMKLLKKRLFSSPQAFLTTLAKHRESIRRADTYPGASPGAEIPLPGLRSCWRRLQ